MPSPSATFTDELSEVLDLLGDVDRRLRALFDMAAYEELSPGIGRRLQLKANGIEVQRFGLEEIAAGKLG